jgi:hypothetical protein
MHAKIGPIFLADLPCGKNESYVMPPPAKNYIYFLYCIKIYFCIVKNIFFLQYIYTEILQLKKMPGGKT